jgi:imidazolonepropionase-like amidohydrolase
VKSAGMKPMDIIVASTKTAALCCGAGEELGTLEPGKRADILAVKSNPLEDFKALKEPLLVMKDGIAIVDRTGVKAPEAKR